MPQRPALAIIDFRDADQTKRNQFAQLLCSVDWCRYPYAPNTFVTSFLGDPEDEQLAELVESDLAAIAEAVGLESWSAVLVLKDDPESGPFRIDSPELQNRPSVQDRCPQWI